MGGFLAPAVATNPFDNFGHPIEKTFRSWMTRGSEPQDISGKTSENIQHLMNLGEAISAGRCPWSAAKMWSRREENFEARLDAIWLCVSGVFCYGEANSRGPARRTGNR